MASPLKFFLGRSSDMSLLGTLDRAKGKSVTIDNNKSGAAQFTLRLDHPLAQQLVPWYNCLVVQYEDEWVWSGPLSAANYDLAAGTVSVSALGWFEVLLPRLVADNIPLTSIDAALVARALLDAANSVFPTGITFGDYETTQTRTRTYVRDTSIGQEIQALGELESGYDWYIDPRSRKLEIVERRGEDRPNVKWIFIHDGNKGHGNCNNVVINVDGTTIVNDLTVRGNNNSAAYQFDGESQNTYGMRQEVVSLSDVTDPDILDAYAVAEILYRKDPKITYQISPMSDQASGVPVIFQDFRIGDTTYLTARRDNYEVKDQAVRIFGVEISVNDDGSTSLSRVQTSAN